MTQPICHVSAVIISVIIAVTVVVMIPKPDKPDYSQPKVHRPISLLETMSKLMEKVIAQCFQHDLVELELVRTTQFGGRRHSSCLDAGLTLLHDIQAAHGLGLKCSVLLFDVKCYVSSLLTTVQLRYNGSERSHGAAD